VSEVLARYREQFPAYQNVDDATLATGMFTKFYADKMSREEFDAKIGLKASSVRDPRIGRPPPAIELIGDERMLEGTGLPPGTSIINAPPQDPGVLAESGRSGQRIVTRGGRQYMTPDRAMVDVVQPPDPNLGGIGGDVYSAPDQGQIEADQLSAEGAVKGEAPSQIRSNAGYAPDPERGYQRAFGPNVDVRNIESAGPLKGETVFRRNNPTPGEDPPAWMTVRNKGGGVSMGDLRSLEGEALPIAGSMGGGVLGGMVTGLNTAGALGGTFAGSFVGEMLRLNEGKNRGMLPKDFTAMDYIWLAAKRGGAESLGAAGGMAAYRLYKAFRGRGMPDLNMTPEQFKEAFAKRAAGLDSEAQPLLKVGDVVGETPAGAEVAALEQKISSAPGDAGRLFRERAQAKEVYGESELRGLTRGDGRPVLGDQAMGGAVRAAAPDTSKRLAGLGPTLHPDLPQAGEAVRGGLKRAQDAAEAQAQVIYAEVDSKLAGKTVVPLHTDIAAQAYRDVLKGDVFKDLTEEDAKLIKGWFGEAYEKIPGGDKGDMRLRPLTYDQLDRGLKSLRRAIGKSYRGEWNGDLEMLSKLETNLVDDRARLIAKLPDGPQVAAKLDQAEGLWKDLKGQFRRTKINDWLKLNASGGKAVGDEAAGSRIFSDPETARVVGSILKGPEHEKEREAVRAMMRWEISRTAKGGGGDVAADALKRAVSDNEPTLRNFFSPEEIRSMLWPAALMKTRKAMGLKPGMDESKWFDGFFKDANPRNAQTTMDRLRRASPETAKDVQAMARQRIYQSLSVEGEQATGRAVDPKKFEKFLDEPGRADWLAHVLDPGFGTRLRKLAEAMQTLNPPSQKITGAGEMAPTVVGQLKTGSRIFLGALTRESRIYNYAVNNLSEHMREKTARALLDPDEFARLLTAAKRTNAGRATGVVLGQYLLRQDRTEVPETPSSWGKTTRGAIGSMFGMQDIPNGGRQ